MEQVKLYTTPKFDNRQMKQIRKNLTNGLSVDEIKEKYSLASRRNRLNRILKIISSLDDVKIKLEQ